jgi:aspartate/methionine/tyrosine aminotransferase
LDDSLINRGDPEGNDNMSDLISEHYDTGRGRVLLTNGTSEANTLAFLSTVEKGSRVLVEKPVYEPLIEIPRAMGCDIFYIKRRPDAYGIDPGELEEKLSGGVDLLVLQNPNNPSGRVLFGPAQKRIADVVSDFDIPVIVDEVYRDFTLQHLPGGGFGPAMPSFVDFYDKAMVTASVTKVYGASGLMTGWLVGPKRLINHSRKIKRMMVPMVSHLGNRVALEMLRRRADVLPNMFEKLRDIQLLVSKWAAGRSDVHWSEPDGCAVGFLRYDHDIPSMEMARVLYHEYGVRVLPGVLFHMEGGIRIGMGKEYDEVKGGLTMIDGYLDTLS